MATSSPTFVSTKGNLIDSKGAVVGKAAAGTTGTFSEGVAPLSAAGSAQSTARATSSSNPHDAPGYDPTLDPTSSLNSKTPAPTTPLAAPINTATGAPANPAANPSAIDTSRPSPDSVQINPASNQATPEQVKAIADATTQVNDMASKYQTGLANAKATGANPTTAGEAAGVIKDNLPGQQNEAPSVVGDIMNTDSSFDSILTNYDNFHSSVNQQTSLVQEYQNMSKSLGIDAINTDLINAKNIIDGTEDDIRNEVTAANGFATDSQVQAMANARNKTLTKNYNTLLDTRNNAMTQLSTMMNLSTQDRQMAQAEFDSKMNFAFKVQDYKDKAIANAKEGLNGIISQTGYAGLYKATGGDPTQTSQVEKTLGLIPGSLKNLAAIPDKNAAKTAADLALTKAQTANQYSEIAARGTTATAADQSAAASWAQNIRSGNAKLSDITGSPTLKNQVSQLLAQGGSSQEDILTTTQASLKSLQDMIDTNHGFSDAVGFRGPIGTFTGPIAGTAAADFASKAKQVMNDVVLPNLTLLHGLGRVTDREFQALQSAVTSLNVDPKSGTSPLSETQFKSELKTITDTIAAKANQAGMSGGNQPKLLQPTEIPSGYYQASDGLLYKK